MATTSGRVVADLSLILRYASHNIDLEIDRGDSGCNHPTCDTIDPGYMIEMAERKRGGVWGMVSRELYGEAESDDERYIRYIMCLIRGPYNTNQGFQTETLYVPTRY